MSVCLCQSASRAPSTTPAGSSPPPSPSSDRAPPKGKRAEKVLREQVSPRGGGGGARSRPRRRDWRHARASGPGHELHALEGNRDSGEGGVTGATWGSLGSTGGQLRQQTPRRQIDRPRCVGDFAGGVGGGDLGELWWQGRGKVWGATGDDMCSRVKVWGGTGLREPGAGSPPSCPPPPCIAALSGRDRAPSQ